MSNTFEIFHHFPHYLMTVVIPTILRRLKTNWRRWGEEGKEEYGTIPLPQLTSTTLFSDLNLPEINIILPDGEVETMPVAQGMREFAPARQLPSSRTA